MELSTVLQNNGNLVISTYYDLIPTVEFLKTTVTNLYVITCLVMLCTAKCSRIGGNFADKIIL